MALSQFFSDRFAYRLFGGYARKNRQNFFDLEINLRKANISTPSDIYASRLIFLGSLAAAAVSLICLVFAARRIPDFYDGFSYLLPDSLKYSIIGALAGNSVLMLFIVLVASFAVSFMIFCYALAGYPKYIASARESEINLTLPHAVTFMYAMSKGGMNPLDVFRALCDHKDIYGEVAVEMESVVRSVELLGYDLITAIKVVSDRTPSEPLKNFFESMTSLMESGGDMTTFLHSRSEQYRVVASQEQKVLTDMLSMFAEIYVTAFIAGPLFLMTIMVIIGLISVTDIGQIQFLIYFLIPVGSILFIWFLSAMGLGDGRGRISIRKKKLNEYEDVNKRELLPSEDVAIRRAQFRYRVRKFLDNPISYITNDPYKVLYVSAPAGVLFVLVTGNGYLDLSYGSLSQLDDMLLIGFFIAVLPFVVFWEARNSRIKKIDTAIPEFLKRLAGVNESGLTLALAIKTLLKSNLGVLNVEIRKMCADIEWGADTRDALIRFERRINTASIRRMVTLIVRANESTGNIKDTLEIAAADASANLSRKEERFSNMLVYVSIIYISFFVFLYIIYTLVSVFLPILPGIPADSSTHMASMGFSFMDISGTGMLHLLFYHSVLIQGLFSGVMAGMMGEGNVASGLKHSLLMMATGYAVFMIFI
ncbi:hypothetical protein CUJ83_13745 [Methanocella sp. CWC-04]|uniref:Type II secretion system protein GspF domain-containing protein n=1 Tax=Methanooceanicella nereidis TaxID=2052831 RepID=A0AAP2RFE1_9EURY|nr:type II secretion system F family protein [Methanocella sp. CWC-04]MCD1296062.1 hypothetical protein [Methanocella sp. CWC-04]